MTRTCLVSIFHPGNVLAVSAAVRWYGHIKSGKEDANVIIVIHVPGLSENDLNEIRDVVDRIILVKGVVRTTIVSDDDLKKVKKIKPFGLYHAVNQKFRDIVGADHIDEIYFSHDVIGDIPKLSMNAYPDAEYITFGDALGSVYNAKFHLSLAKGVTCSRTLNLQVLNPFILLNYVKSTASRYLAGGPVQFNAKKAVLILPMDQLGDGLIDKELIVVPKDFVRQIISDIIERNPDLDAYFRKLLSRSPEPRYLLLLENISDGKFTSFESEVALYCEVVQRNIPKNSTIFIKPHPLSLARIDKALFVKLQSDYLPVILPEKCSKYPIEFWRTMVDSCEIISLSYPSISLKFLYDKRVIYALDSKVIEQYIDRKYWESYKNSDLMYRGQLANLASWDGKSVLWSGRNI